MPSFKSMPRPKKGRAANAPVEQPPVRKQSTKRLTFKRLLVLLLLLLMVIIISIGITIYLTWPASADFLKLKIDSQNSAALATEPKAEPISLPTEQPLFLTLEPFTVTITDGSRSRAFYVGITPQVADEASRLLLEKYKPMVRDRILRILSEQHPTQVQTPEGREQLVSSLLSALSLPYDASLSTSPRILNVLFTAFVIQ